MTPTLYLLDTNVLLALIRGNQLGQFILATYQPLSQPQKPLISAVVKGEIRALARQFGWGAAKLQTLDQLLRTAVTSVEIDRDDLIDAYVEADWLSYSHPAGSINLGKNDLWIAATAHVQGATLLTTDQDFDHLQPAFIQRIYIDPTSRLPAGP